MRAKIVLSLLLLNACAAADAVELELDDGPRAELSQAVTAVVDHGNLKFGDTAVDELTDGAKSHAWEFDLPGEADVTAQTLPPGMELGDVDTVVSLYRARANGWGSAIASNDDAGGTRWSRLQKNLTPGRYRVLVKGHRASVRGRFALVLGCEGAGCRPPAAPIDTRGCLFGVSTQDLIAARDDLRIVGRETLNSSTPLTPAIEQQV